MVDPWSPYGDNSSSWQPCATSREDETDLLGLSMVPTRTSLTRVMSPRTQQANMGLLLGYTCECPICTAPVTEPAVCCQCGNYGHPHCLGLEYFQGFPVCGTCMCSIVTEYAKQEDYRKREEWKLYYTQQLAKWRQRATSAIGVSSAVGTMIGGATALVAGSAVGLAKGIGDAVATATRGRQQAIEPPPTPGANTPGTALVRSFSAECVPSRADERMSLKQSRELGHCLACHTSNPGHHPHLRYGDCVGFPGRGYYGNRPAPKSLTDVPESSTGTQDHGLLIILSQ